MAGLLGGSVVAVLFFLVDLARGQPLRVPDALGHVLFHLGGGGSAEGEIAHVMVYSIFHFVAFMIVGIASAAVLRRSERQPSILAGALLCFVVFEAGFIILAVLMTQSSRLGMPAWYMVTIGNLLAAVVMGWYLSRLYPRLTERADAVLGGRHGA